jgi:N-formylglutamate deformylase
MKPFNIIPASNTLTPIVISVPHCGTQFPDDLRGEYKDHLVADPDDTDLFVERLYSFAPAMGMTMIHAVYNRWVIDLNRDPASKPLYTDGRLITGLCPSTTFTGERLYKDEREEVDQRQVNERIEKYFNPYHEALKNLLRERLAVFGKVLLWDCHSIRQEVKSIYPNRFPDLILGSNDGFAAGSFITEIALKSLSGSSYTVEHNFLFKGGYITRHFGQPVQQQHALQLEMTKVNYMDDSEKHYEPARAGKMQDLLRRTFEKLITVLSV